MGEFRRLKLIGLAVAAVGIAAVTNGCSSASQLANSVCCTDFKPGTDMSATVFISGNAQANGQFVAFAQAAGDISVVAGAALSDVTTACKNIAVDLGDDPGNMGAQGKTGTDLLNFWCGEAAAKISASGVAKGTLTIAFQPPKCDVSVQAQASCQGGCSANAMCDVKANPPTCMGGTLEVQCSGTCMATAMAPTIDCTGSCSGMCSGGCTGSVSAPIDCNGKCDGTCAAKAGVGNGMGANADGTCQGTCTGTCTMSAMAQVSCSGTCSGQCTGNCSPPMGGSASVQCSGMCMAQATPLSCKGGTLQGGCMVDANCQANCSAHASAQAQCNPPSLTITASGAANANVQAVIDTLKVNLPVMIVAIQARGQAFLGQIQAVASEGVSIIGSGNLDAHATACFTFAALSVGAAAGNFTATLSASAMVTGMVM